MALKIKKQTALGTVFAEYWRPYSHSVNHITRTAHVVVGGYIDRDQRNAGEPIQIRKINVPQDMFLALVTRPSSARNLFEGTEAVLYEIIRTDPYFEGAEDIFESGQKALA